MIQTKYPPFGCAPCPGTACQLHLLILGCSSLPLGSALVTLSQLSLPVASVTSDWTPGTAVGNAVLDAPAGTYDLTVTRARFADYSGTVTLACGAEATVIQLEPDDALEELGDFVCACVGCAVPVAKTLTLFNALVGDLTLTYFPQTDPPTRISPMWSGCALIPAEAALEGCATTGAADIPVRFDLICYWVDIESPELGFRWYLSVTTRVCAWAGPPDPPEGTLVTAGGACFDPDEPTDLLRTEVPIPGTVCACPPDGDGLIVRFPALAIPDLGIPVDPAELGLLYRLGDTIVYEGETIPGTPPAEVVVRVHAPDCPGADPPTTGTPIVGATVTLYRTGDEVTVIDSGTTDAEGLVTLELDGWGSYTIVAEDAGGCEGRGGVSVAPCTGIDPEEPVTADVTICCTVVPFEVLDSVTNNPLEDAVVLLPDGTPLTTDAAGLTSPTTLTTATMLALAIAGDGSDCGVRVLPVSVSRPDIGGVAYLYVCTTVEVACGEDGVTPHTIHLVQEPAHTITWTNCCEDLGCTVAGPEGRGLLYTLLSVTYTGAATRGVLSWDYLFEGEAALVVDGFGNPSLGSLGGLLYRSGCVSGLFITPGAEGCGESNDQTQSYISARFEIEMCIGAPPHLRIDFFPAAACNNAGLGESETPACDTAVVVEQEVPTDVLTMCAGSAVAESWSQAISGGSIDHSLALTGVTSP